MILGGLPLGAGDLLGEGFMCPLGAGLVMRRQLIIFIETSCFGAFTGLVHVGAVITPLSYQPRLLKRRGV